MASMAACGARPETQTSETMQTEATAETEGQAVKEGERDGSELRAHEG